MNLVDIEKSIIKEYRKEIWKNFIDANNEFHLIEDNDVIAVCISGGKDSFLLAKCIQELKRHGKIKFDAKYIVMDPGYKKSNLRKIISNAKKLNIDIYIYKSDIFNNIKDTKSPCYLCARKRRGALYSEAQKLGCNKIALGHHFDDVIETILMSIIYNGEFKTMKPILDSTNFKEMKLIRPLYYVREKDIVSWVKNSKLSFLDCACIVTKKDTNKRSEMKQLIKHLNNIYKCADINIMNSTKNINLNTVLSYVNNMDTTE